MSNLSATQLTYLANAWRCFEAEPKVDFEKFARLCNLKSAASAREMLRTTKKKLFELTDGDATSSASGTPAAAAGAAAATPKKGGAGAKGGAKTPASGKKRGRPAGGSAKKGKQVVKEEEDGVEEDEGRGMGKKSKTAGSFTAASTDAGADGENGEDDFEVGYGFGKTEKNGVGFAGEGVGGVQSEFEAYMAGESGFA